MQQQKPPLIAGVLQCWPRHGTLSCQPPCHGVPLLLQSPAVKDFTHASLFLWNNLSHLCKFHRCCASSTVHFSEIVIHNFCYTFAFVFKCTSLFHSNGMAWVTYKDLNIYTSFYIHNRFLNTWYSFFLDLACITFHHHFYFQHVSMKHELHTLHSTVNNFIQSPHCFMSKRNLPFNTCTTCLSLLLQLKLCTQKYNYYIKLIHETVTWRQSFKIVIITW